MGPWEILSIDKHALLCSQGLAKHTPHLQVATCVSIPRVLCAYISDQVSLDGPQIQETKVFVRLSLPPYLC